MSREITGWNWPFRFENGRVAMSSGTEHLKDNVRNIIATGKLEVPMQPEYGCDLNRRVFDPVNTLALAEGDIKDAIARFEPRVNLLGVEIDNQ